MLTTEKCCTKCKVTKPVSEFSKSAKGKDGLSPTCKACRTARYEASKDNPDPVALEKRQRRAEERRNGVKTCAKCKVTKPVSDFYQRGGQNSYLQNCKLCSKIETRKWFKAHPEVSKNRARRITLQKYGLTIADYDKLVKAQSNVCAICGKVPTGTIPRSMRLAIDHCHVKGHIRGLLCLNCNRALGLFKDDPKILRRAISYLLRNG